MLRALGLAGVMSVAWLAVAGLPASWTDAGLAVFALVVAGVLGARMTDTGPAKTPFPRKLLAGFWALRAALLAIARMPRLVARAMARPRPGEFVRVVVDAPTDLGRTVAAGGLALSGAGVLVEIDGAGVLVHTSPGVAMSRQDVDAARATGASLAGIAP